jgi:hypothetical protein
VYEDVFIGISINMPGFHTGLKDTSIRSFSRVISSNLESVRPAAIFDANAVMPSAINFLLESREGEKQHRR